MKQMQLTRSKHIVPYATFLTKVGEPVCPLLLSAGLPSNCLANPQTLVPTAALWRFRELAANRTGLPNLTWDVVGNLNFSALGAIANIVLREPTLIKMVYAFENLVKAESSTPSINVQPCADGGVYFIDRLSMRQEQGKWHAELYILLWMIKIVQLIEPNWFPAEISCISEANPERVQVIKSLGAVPRFKQCCTSFKIPAAMIAKQANGRRKVQRNLQSEDDATWSPETSGNISGAVKQLIRAYVCDGWLTAREASQLAGTSMRTLQRRLSAEHATYTSLLEEVRAELAGNLLENTDTSISDICAQLGYRDQGNFTRAFRRWAGVPPTLFRSHRRTNRAVDGA